MFQEVEEMPILCGSVRTARYTYQSGGKRR